MLEAGSGSSSTRAWAALGLGELCASTPLPWQSVIGAGLNYLIEDETLTSDAGGALLEYP